MPLPLVFLGWLAAWVATVLTERLIAITTPTWTLEVAKGLDCDILSLHCSRSERQILVAANSSAWRSFLSQIIQDNTSEPTSIIAVGFLAYDSFRAAERESGGSRTWRHALAHATGSLIGAKTSQDNNTGFLPDHITRIAILSENATRWSKSWCMLQEFRHERRNIDFRCGTFEVEQGVFIAGASAALVPWPRKRFAVISDKTLKPDESVIYHSFLLGVHYVDPDIVVERLQLSFSNGDDTASSVGSEILTNIKADVLFWLNYSVVYLDLDCSSASMGLRALQDLHNSDLNTFETYAITSAEHTTFESSGAPVAAWRDVIFTSIGLDITRAIGRTLRCWSGTKKWRYYLSVANGFVETLWSKHVTVDSTIPNEKIGVLEKVPVASRSAARTCGSISIGDHLEKEVVSPMRPDPDDASFSGRCFASVQCCNFSAGVHSWKHIGNLEMMSCGPEYCGAHDQRSADSMVQDRVCGRGVGKIHSCPKETSGIRLVGVGLVVNNIAEVDLPKGSFYIDCDIYLYEEQDLYTEDALKEKARTCVNPALAKTMALTHQEFVKFIYMVGRGRYVEVTPRIQGEQQFVNFKGNYFFRTELKEWPFDTQALIISFATFDDRVKLCVMEGSSALHPDIRLVGLRQESQFKKLKMDYFSSYACGPPFKHPERKKCLAYDHQRYCSQCEGERNHEIGPPGPFTCRCMEGALKQSKVYFQISFSRPKARTFLTIYFPPSMIMVLNQAPLFLHVEASTTRLGMCASALLSTVMYHISIMDNTPQVAQDATRADAFMLLCYGINLITWLMTMMQYMGSYSQIEDWRRLSEKRKERRIVIAEWVKTSFWYKARWYGPTVCVSLVSYTLVRPLKALVFLAVVAILTIALTAFDFKYFVRNQESPRYRLQCFVPLVSILSLGCSRVDDTVHACLFVIAVIFMTLALLACDFRFFVVRQESPVLPEGLNEDAHDNSRETVLQVQHTTMVLPHVGGSD